MVFSRYVAILRGSSHLRRSLLDFEVSPNIFLCQSTANFRSSAIRAESQPEISQNPPPEIPGVHPDNVATVKPNILGFTSQSATACNSEPSAVDGFDSDNFIDYDISMDKDLRECKGLPGALETCDEDLSHIVPYHQPSFNFAAYANNSPTIQELAKLGVELYKVEAKKGGMKILLRQNFDEMKPYIQFLHDCGVPANKIGEFITRNPYFFTQDMDDLHTRIRYLRAHKFDRDSVTRIVSKNPYWLMFPTQKIDQRLGHFQSTFELSGPQIRTLATREPRVITLSIKHINDHSFAFKEEMGFQKWELKSVLLTRPGLFMRSRKLLVNIFDYVHNTLGLSHETLAKQPMILTCRLERLRNRHRFLESLGKNQYDPTKPLYVSPDAIVGGTDLEFCRNVAKTTIHTYNLYLKSL